MSQKSTAMTFSVKEVPEKSHDIFSSNYTIPE